jgi:hypothetical protein
VGRNFSDMDGVFDGQVETLGERGGREPTFRLNIARLALRQFLSDAHGASYRQIGVLGRLTPAGYDPKPRAHGGGGHVR